MLPLFSHMKLRKKIYIFINALVIRLLFFFGEEFLMKHCDYVPLRKGGVSIILNMLGLFEYVRHIFEYVLV